jgi:hypothetical protein
MSKTFIGTKFVTQVGGTPQNPIGEDEVVGQVFHTHFTDDQLKDGGAFVGTQFSTIFGDYDFKKLDETISQIKSSVEKYEIGAEAEVKTLTKDYQLTSDGPTKIALAEKIIAIGANISQIASLILQLKSVLPELS